MNASKLTGAVGSFVVMFGLGGLWHTVLMADYYEAIMPTVARAEPNMVVVGFGYLITAVVMALVFPIGYKGGSGVAEGLRFGAVIGLLWWLPRTSSSQVCTRPPWRPRSWTVRGTSRKGQPVGS